MIYFIVDALVGNFGAYIACENYVYIAVFFGQDHIGKYIQVEGNNNILLYLSLLL